MTAIAPPSTIPAVLDGGQVILRAIAPSDHDALFELERDLETWELRRPSPPVPLDRPTWDGMLAKRLSDTDAASGFAIEADGAFVGTCALVGIDAFSRHADVGIGLLASARGRGLGTAALRALVDFAFVRRNLRRLQLEVLATNAGAVASYRKVGFVEEGRRRSHAWVRGRYEDELVMGLLRDEARGGPPPAA